MTLAHTLVELPSGLIINLAAIREFEPSRSNRIDYLDGYHRLLSWDDGLALRLLSEPTEGSPRMRARAQAAIENGGESRPTPRRTRKTKTQTENK